MAHIDQLENYFAAAHAKRDDIWVGSEVETFFVTSGGSAITIGQSQSILRNLTDRGWDVGGTKNGMLTEVTKATSRIQYELGYPNLELSVCPQERHRIIPYTRHLLEDLYRAAELSGAYPLFAPIFPGTQSYLAIPDDRDATWLRLDGKLALSPLACISAVQFTVDTALADVRHVLRNLWKKRGAFLEDYPQDAVWREYIRTSLAGYREDRYGGSEEAFSDLWHYCKGLSLHAVVKEDKLVPFDDADLGSNRAISLFIRSVWWYFRLRRYGECLCVEVRPIPRRGDDMLQQQLDAVLDTVYA